MKTENWNGYDIRFVEVDNEWFAIGNDVTTALEYKNGRKAIRDHVEEQDKNTVTIRSGIKGNPNKLVISEFGIYDLIFNSKMPQAKEFKRWVFNVIKTLREETGLQGFEVFSPIRQGSSKEGNVQIAQRFETSCSSQFYQGQHGS